MNDTIVNIDQSNAQEYLIDESTKRPVLVDFWADWCEPCKQLMPVLEKLANEYNGDFLLAKVNADEQAMIAQQLRVQSLPTVMLIKDGQPIDGFAGLQPENAIREMLDKYLPKPWDKQLGEAELLMANNDFSAALPLLSQAWQQSSKQDNISKAYAHCLIETHRLDEAEAVLGDIMMADQDATYEQLMAQLDLKRQAAESPEIKALEDKLAAEPNNADVAMQLAAQYTEAFQHEKALACLLEIIRNDRDNAEAKKVYLEVLKTLGAGDPVAVKYQRKFYSLMY